MHLQGVMALDQHPAAEKADPGHDALDHALNSPADGVGFVVKQGQMRDRHGQHGRAQGDQPHGPHPGGTTAPVAIEADNDADRRGGQQAECRVE